MNTALVSYKLVVVAYQICIYDDTDSIALYMLAAPDSVIFLNELESVLKTMVTHQIYITKNLYKP